MKSLLAFWELQFNALLFLLAWENVQSVNTVEEKGHLEMPWKPELCPWACGLCFLESASWFFRKDSLVSFK